MPAKSFYGGSGHYSLPWARTIIGKLNKIHARGTEKICCVLEISREDLARYLAYSDPIYPVLRDGIHFWEDLEGCSGTTTQKLSEFKDYLRIRSPDRIASYLDKLENRHRIKEQA